MQKQNSPRINEFDAICMTARRSPTRGKIGNYVGQMTVEGFANCTSPSNPRQQIRRYVKTPWPNSLAQKWIAVALQQSWKFDGSNRSSRRQEVLDAARRIGFWFETSRYAPDGTRTQGYFKAYQQGGLVPSLIRETTRDTRHYNTRSTSTAILDTPILIFPNFVDSYLQILNTIPYGFSAR